jgi:hypothetical protein
MNNESDGHTYATAQNFHGYQQQPIAQQQPIVQMQPVEFRRDQNGGASSFQHVNGNQQMSFGIQPSENAVKNWVYLFPFQHSNRRTIRAINSIFRRKSMSLWKSQMQSTILICNYQNQNHYHKTIIKIKTYTNVTDISKYILHY